MQYDYAGVIWRIAAGLVDGFVLAIPNTVIIFALGGLTSTGFELEGLPALTYMAAVLALSLAYFVGLETSRGATLGKMALGMRVVKVDGSPVDLQAAVIRHLMRYVEFGCCFLIGLIPMIQSQHHQRFGDRLANTVVVRKTT